MFFILAKILSFLLKPLNILAGIGLYALFAKDSKRKRRAYVLLLALLLFCSNPWVINEFLRRWEIGHKDPATIFAPYEVGIVLGGYTNMSAAQPTGVVTFNRAGNRINTALTLYKTGKIKRILLSGGSGRLIGTEQVEARVARWYLQQTGVPDSVILLEDQSRSTWENAVFSKQVLDSLGYQGRPLLITSAWHLRRAKGCFETIDLPCDLFGADFFAEQDLGNPYKWLEPDWEALMKWEYLLKEWVGYWAYRLSGKI